MLESAISSLERIRSEIYRDALFHGFYKDSITPQKAIELIIDEVNEANQEVTSCTFDGEKFTEELSDVIIIILSVCSDLKLDISNSILKKIAKNKSRSYLHQGEK